MKKKTALPVEPEVVKTPVKRVSKAKKVVPVVPEVTVPAEPVVVEALASVSAALVAKSTRSTRHQQSVVGLFNELYKALGRVNDKAYVNEMYKAGLKIKDCGSDEYHDRRAMLDLLKEALSYIRFEKRMVLEVNPAWAEAKRAWIRWVSIESVRGHQGQLAMARTFFTRFAGIEARVASLWEDGPDAMDRVLDDLDTLTLEVANFVQEWCTKCGAPVREITPKNGKLPFTPKLCQTCFGAPVVAEVSFEPKHRKVKKPGSAAKRGQNRGPKGHPKAEADGEKKRAKAAAKAARHGEGK